MMFSEELNSKIKNLQDKYVVKRAALLPAMHIVEDEYGYIGEDACRDLAELFELAPAEIAEVCSFYSMFSRDPVGEYVIRVCKTLTCHLGGAPEILNHIEEKLDIKTGETTEDGKFTLQTFECLGACDVAPVMQINDKQYEHLTLKKVDNILEELS